MSNPEFTAEQQRPAHLFKPGQSGNPAGRPKGSRSKFSEAFIADLHVVWERHGMQALERCAVEEPGQFLRVCAGLLPSDVSLTVGVSAETFVQTFRSAQALLGNPEPQPRRRLPNQKLIDHAG